MIFEYIQSLFNKYGCPHNRIKSLLIKIKDHIDFNNLKSYILNSKDNYDLLLDFSNTLEVMENFSNLFFILITTAPYIKYYQRSEKKDDKTMLHSLKLFYADDEYTYHLQINYTTGNTSKKDIHYTLLLTNKDTGDSNEFSLDPSIRTYKSQVYNELINLVLRSAMFGAVKSVRGLTIKTLKN